MSSPANLEKKEGCNGCRSILPEFREKDLPGFTGPALLLQVLRTPPGTHLVQQHQRLMLKSHCRSCAIWLQQWRWARPRQGLKGRWMGSKAVPGKPRAGGTDLDYLSSGTWKTTCAYKGEIVRSTRCAGTAGKGLLWSRLSPKSWRT